MVGRDRGWSGVAVKPGMAAQGLVTEFEAVSVVDEPVEIASAKVASPMTMCQSAIGSWLVTMVERRP